MAKKPTYSRGMTFQSQHSPETRPPRVQGRVGNEFWPDKVRSATMPPPTDDTEEPRMSKREGARKTPTLAQALKKFSR
jgi:hypothetical protein